MLTPGDIDKLRNAVRRTEGQRNDPYEVERWSPYISFPPIVTILITGPVDPTTGLYDGLIVDSVANSQTLGVGWDVGSGGIKVKPANEGDIFQVGRRYPGRPGHADDVTSLGTDQVYADDVYIAYPTGAGSVINLGTGTGTGLGTGTWYDLGDSIITINESTVYVTSSTLNIINTTINQTNVTNVYNDSTFDYSNSTIVYNNSTITFGPNVQLVFNFIQPIIVQQNINWNLANNVNFVINGGVNNSFIVNVPMNVNNNFLGLMNIIAPVNVAQNPLPLPCPGMFFRMRVNVPNAAISGMSPGAVSNPGRMVGIINAGPQRAKWHHLAAADPTYNVQCPDGTAYYHSINELLFLYADGSSNDWVLSAHRELADEIGTGTGSYDDGTVPLDPPTVTAVSPNTGDVAGGDSIGVTGTNFVGVTDVLFGATSATSFMVNSPTSITAVAPAHAVGVVDVTVVTSSGTSATSASDLYTYTFTP